MIKVPLLRHQRYISPLQLTSRVRNQRQKTNVDFDTFDGHVMVNFIEPNFQDIIFTLSTVSLITQKQFLDHLKNFGTALRSQFASSTSFSPPRNTVMSCTAGGNGPLSDTTWGPKISRQASYFYWSKVVRVAGEEKIHQSHTDLPDH
jgi:hypothetical protein